MIRINIVSRISEDKNSFFDVIYLVKKLEEAGQKDIQLLFIGGITSNTLYNDMMKLVGLFELSEKVSFTRRSIRFDDLPQEIKEGYFLNFTIGNFKGFSGIESIRAGFKTLFYNVDKKLSAKTERSESQVESFEALMALILKIIQNKAATDKLIIADNLRMMKSFALNEDEVFFLRSVLNPE